MFDDNNQNQQAPDNAQPASLPAPMPSGNLGFSGNAIDNSPTPISGTTGLAPSTEPANDDTSTKADTSLMSNDSGGFTPEPPATDSVGSTPPLPDAPTDTLTTDSPALANDDSSSDDNHATTSSSTDELPEPKPVDAGSDDSPPPVDDQANEPPEKTSDDDGADQPPSDDPSGPPTDGNSSLLDIKQQALQQLSPLVSHLDQTPEEKFRTTMMMIQATDDQSLIQSAYDTAQKIEDSKAKAQALLELINEVNYFTQQAKNNDSNSS